MKETALAGRVALVTGASEGMGKSASFYLSKLGVNIALVSRRLGVIKRYAEQIKEETGTEPIAIRADLTKDKDVKEAIHKVLKKYKRIDFIANFAGNPSGYLKGYRKKAIYEQSIRHLKAVAEVDHFGSVRVLKYAMPHMIRQKYGKVILISSTASVYGYSEDVDYVPYKKANEGLAKTTALRSERDMWGVELYVLAPGDVYNPSTWNSYSVEERREAIKYGVIESKAVAQIVSFILSGRLKQKYVMKVDVDKGEVIDEGHFEDITNGDTIVVDAKTIKKLFESVNEPYIDFSPPGLMDLKPT